MNPTDLTADARITLETGGRYEFGALELDQDVIDDDLLRAYVRFAPGQPYSPEQLNGTQYALEDSNYFSTVVVSPGERDREHPDRAGQDPRRADQAQPLRRQRRLRHRHGHPRPVHLGQPPGQYARSPLARRTDGVRGPLRGAGALRDSRRRSEPRKAGVLARLRQRGHRRPQERTHRTHGRPDPGVRQVAAGPVPEAQRRTHDLPGRQDRRRPAADPGHQLCEPAAELPDGLGARRGVLRRIERQPGNARIRRFVPALLRPGRARLADPRALVRARSRGTRHQLGRRLLRAALPRSASSPAATAACAALRSTH